MTYFVILQIFLNLVAEEANKKTPFPCPTTYRVAFSHYLDISTPVRSNVLKELAEYAQDAKDKEFLLKISSPTPEGKVDSEDLIFFLLCLISFG